MVSPNPFSTKPPEAPASTALDPKRLEPHPLAEKLPAMSKEEFDALKDSIRAPHGLLTKITVYEGKVLDGRHRLKAGIEAGYRFKPEDFVEYTGSDPLEFVMATNVHRRQMNESQRALVAAGLADATFGANQYSRIRVTQEAAAKMLNVSVALLKIAKEVTGKASKEQIDEIMAGKKKVSAVKKAIDEAEKAKAEAEAKAKAKAQSAPQFAPQSTGEPDTATGSPPIAPSAPLDPNEKIKVKVRNETTGRWKTVEMTRAQAAELQKKEEEEARKAQVEAIKDEWNDLDEQQKRAFVIAFKAEIAAHLKYLDQQMSMAA
jgi:hypothetical protein